MYVQFATVAMFCLVGAAFVILNVSIVSRIVRPKVADPEKEETYECGEPAIGSAWIRFDIRFYTIALVFLIFAVEVAFMYPWALVYKRLKGAGSFVFVEMLVFLLILAVGFVYAWAKGDLDWIRSVVGQQPSSSAQDAPSEKKRVV
jgi:NADH-quinone oxidoreductase subunit A